MLRTSLAHPPRDIVTVIEKVVQQPVLTTGDLLPDTVWANRGGADPFPR